MNYQTARTLLEKESTAIDVLTGCQCYFDKVEEIAGSFATGMVDNPIKCRQVLNESTSLYLLLNPLLALAITEKDNKEMLHYVEEKRRIENSGGKFVATSQSNESSAYVSTYRRIRNVLEGYVESIKVSISTCQSNLKSMADEARMTNSGNQAQ